MGTTKLRNGVASLQGPQPEITLSGNALDFPDTLAGDISASQNILVSGANLVGDILIPLSANFIANTDGSEVNAAPFSINGIIATAVYFRFAPSVAGPYDRICNLTSPGAVSKSVHLTGDGT